MPWLYYAPTVTEDVLNSEDITTEFQVDMTLALTAAKYLLEGAFVSLEPISVGMSFHAILAHYDFVVI